MWLPQAAANVDNHPVCHPEAFLEYASFGVVMRFGFAKELRMLVSHGQPLLQKEQHKLDFRSFSVR